MAWFGRGPPMAMPMGVPSILGVPVGVPQMQQQQQQHQQQQQQGAVENMHRKRDIPSGPAVTVFIGNITERAPDPMVRHLLTTCGIVLSWKRVQGATGKLQAFGFCEFSNPDAGLRAVRILNGYSIADKGLVVKVDAKTKQKLLDYLKERIKKVEADEPEEDEETLKFSDDDMKIDDKNATDRIKQILLDHKTEMDAFVSRETPQFPIQPQNKTPTQDIIQKIGTRDEGLEGVEEEKKGVISKEIEKFRETMKVREVEREEAEQKKEKERERRSSPPSSRRSRDRSPKREKDRSVRESKERESRSDSKRASRRRTPTPPRPSRVSRSRSRDRERERERDRERERERERRRTRERSTERKSAKEMERDREVEIEEKEKQKMERKAAEKEENYRTRLENWERREAKKLAEWEKEKKKEKKKTEEMEREGRKLKEFLEDYDDEKDDPKYYKNRELARRMTNRERESAKDAEDRLREQEELDELKNKIYSNPTVKDPDAEYQKKVREMELEFLPPGAKQKEKERAPPSPQNEPPSPSPDRDDNGGGGMSPAGSDDDYGGYDNGNGADMGDASPDNDMPDSAPPEPTINPISLPGTKIETSSKRRKMQVADIFNQDNDEEDDHKPKKKLKSSLLPPVITENKKDKAPAANNNVAVVDDKKKHIKSLIEKIPTDKTALFEYSIDWDLVDNQLMEKRIRPWINKKIAEYIGEPEPSLTDFICSKVLAGSAPTAILEDVQMVLDDEAEVFVVKMWRLLIYEIENKKQKAMAVK